MTQFYIPQLQPGVKSTDITLSEFQHIVKSHRTKVGDTVQLFNGNGWIFEARVEKILKDKAVLTILKETFVNKRNFQVILCQGLIKFDRFELIIEKCTELGVDKIIPVVTKRTVAPVDKFVKKYERFKKISIEATKQSHGCYLTEILQPTKLFELFPEKDLSFNVVCWKDAGTLLSDFKEKIKNVNRIRIFVGPEGDFTKEEIEFLKDQENTVLVSLSDKILRSETAAIVATSLVLNYKYESK